MKASNANVYDLGDASAIAFAGNSKNDALVEKNLKSWHIVKCANCRQAMSLVDADYNDEFAPIHKNCGDVKLHG